MKKQEQQENKGAVIYVRTASQLQSGGQAVLTNQENLCRDYCDQQQWPVEAVFADAGESSNKGVRPGFDGMLAFCNQNSHKIRYVVVEDSSRIARNHSIVTQTIAYLKNIDVFLRLIVGGEIDDAKLKLATITFAELSEHHSEAPSKKKLGRVASRASSVDQHALTAPVGYRINPIIVPDEKSAPIVRGAFELVASGSHSIADVLRIISDEGLTGHDGRPLTEESLHNLLTNPVYGGWVDFSSDSSTPVVRGPHEPIVSQETFERVQAALGKKKSDDKT